MGACAAALSTAYTGGRRDLWRCLSRATRRAETAPAIARRETPTPLLVKGNDARRSTAPSTDECLRLSAKTRHRAPQLGLRRSARGGPSRRRAGSWLPTLFHRESLARSAARPNATPRALRVWGAKGQAPLVDFCNRKRTASTSRRSSEPRAPRGDRSPPSSRSRVAVRRGWRGQPRGIGPGVPGLSPAHVSTRDRSRVELHPDPMSSSTSCRRPVTAWRGVTFHAVDPS